MILQKSEYDQKISGCWMGKNIGGTLGAPFEWKRQINKVKHYEQELGGEPLPNDDLDIQLLWLIAMEERGIDIDSKVLADYWQLYVTPHWAEYGNAKINMKSGLMPPLSGILNNSFKDSNGCFIRSEIWACISPGCPKIATQMAYEDAIIDHGDGEGMYAEIFCAAVESSAFVINDINKLIDIGLSYIPADCGVSNAIKNVINSYKSGKTWLEARKEILEKYRGAIKPEIFGGKIGGISKEEDEKGYRDGKIGYDAPLNIGILLIGLLYGEGDFSKSITTTINCGEDTDCTAATCGSILGIINGIDSIPKKWKEPIGEKINTAILNIGELGVYGDQLPGSISELSSRIWKITRQVILKHNLDIEILENEETDLSDLKDSILISSEENNIIYKSLRSPIYHYDFFDVTVDYNGNPTIKDNLTKKIILTLENKYKIQEIINIHWYLPDNWIIKPSFDSRVFIKYDFIGSNKERIEFEIFTEKVIKNINRCVVELTFEGRQTVMLVPLVLLNGN